MDVNNFGSVDLPIEKTSEPSKGTKVAPSRDENEISSVEAPQDVTIISYDANQIQTSDLRKKANTAITIFNITTSATDEIGKLITSIGGIVEQANSPQISSSRRDLLEKEANQLVEEIKTKAASTEADGIHPLLGDTVRLEVEQKYGDTLDIILPDTAKDSFGIGQVNLSMKDTILDTITRVEQAKKQFEQLRTSVREASDSVKKTVDTLEVALQNSEASKVTLRTLDEALSLASITHTQIGKSPEAALGSIGKLNTNSVVLLKN